MTPPAAPRAVPPAFFLGQSDLAQDMQALDWSLTPLGSPDLWPDSLRTVVNLLLNTATPMVLLWGEELIQLYNDGYREVMDGKHPAGLGQPTQQCWPEVWSFNAPIYHQVLTQGVSLQFVDQPLSLTRHGGQEDGYFTLSYSPVYDEQSSVAGILVTVSETTHRVLAEHQLQQRTQEVDVRNQALEAFAQLTRDLSLETDRFPLIRRAQEIVLGLLPLGYAVYYELQDGPQPRWRVKSQVGSLGSEALQAVVDAGLRYEAQGVLKPFTSLQPWYQDHYAHGTDTPAEVIGHVNTAVSLPVLIHGKPVGVFCVALFEQRSWTAVDHVVLEAALHNLTSALERAEGVAQVLAERQKLQATNDELEAFTYSVSHDLRTPVRHINGFSSLLRKSLSERLDPASARSLKIIEDSAQRMNALIDAMLDLSRTARQPLQMRLVDLGALVTGLQAELAYEERGRQVEWQVRALPIVMGDPQLLRQVMLNLLSNALKYSRHAAQARIEVWAEEHTHKWMIHVHDNGTGFDNRYKDKLFGVFQRLHRQEEFEGTGVGLATVRRIVLRHGGQVAAEGQVSQGATFCFTLPKLP
ncbi:ATP-binding protein [Deinococcus sp. QL22]|uniref:sensor histidine kinase n=1 Tax=Deinococcus sp. QL22 TaxID=2939437 RepID=UPI002017F76C|nr:ATP-binding protein [Deinococcus sp. QL22]UQN09827.1 ATP-binding protein [Deinococcus sp. QL22]